MNEKLIQNRLPSKDQAQEFFKWASELSKCSHYQKMGSGGVLAILLTARELDLPPMACLNGGMYHLGGKVSLSAQMINSLLLRRGHRADIKTLTEKKCVLEFKRCDNKKAIEYEYTIQDAQIAGYLGKDNWKHSPKDMLFARCLSGGARKICPDALLGPIYCHGEILESSESTQNDEKEDEAEDPEVVQIRFEKAEGYDEFVEKHNLSNEDSDKFQYIKACSEASKNSKEDIINYAVANEKRFLEGFKKWNADRIDSAKKIKSDGDTDPSQDQGVKSID